jgi:hypothetical protein
MEELTKVANDVSRLALQVGSYGAWLHGDGAE